MTAIVKRSLLIVDDEASMLTALKRELRAEPYLVLTASSGEEALEILARHKVEVIISDYGMPGMTGIALLTEARHRYPNIVRMVLSGYADLEAVINAINLGHIYKFLGKPWEAEVLLGSIRDAFAYYDLVRRGSQFSRVFDNTHEGIFILDAQSRIETVNAAFESMTNCTQSELLGDDGTLILDPGAHADYRRLLDTALHNDHARSELWFRRKNSDIFPAALTLSAIRDANGHLTQVIGLCADITERKQRETALLESEKRFRDFMEFAPIGMVIVALDGQLLRVNQALCSILGFSREELEAMHFEALTAPDDLAADLAMRRQLIEGEIDVWKAEKSYLHKDGHTVWVQITAAVLRDSHAQPHCFDVQIEDISERRSQQEQIHRLAYFDALTGLPNRRLLHDRLEQALAQARRNGHLAAIAFLDLDHFKQVNDAHGHEAGDLVLKEAARRLNLCIRRGDTVARQGGDEFIVLLSELADPKDIAIVGGKIVAALAAPYELDTLALRIELITASIGFAIYPRHGVTAMELMKRADAAMYTAKEAGRNAWRLFADSADSE